MSELPEIQATANGFVALKRGSIEMIGNIDAGLLSPPMRDLTISRLYKLQVGHSHVLKDRWIGRDLGPCRDGW